ncbi:MAG: hypothetical protein SW833_21240 [Cyanobacteriota bacterium]|nr:hypothetical protein [Cyanobacteriota bacterium]
MKSISGCGKEVQLNVPTLKRVEILDRDRQKESRVEYGDRDRNLEQLRAARIGSNDEFTSKVAMSRRFSHFPIEVRRWGN